MIEIKNPLKSYSEFPGPILLLAGPGTGKTYQLAMRVKYLIEELEAQSNEITVITFTNEAARNMRERLTHEDINLQGEKHPKIIKTMHSLGNMIIGSNPERFDLKSNYTVLHDDNLHKVLLADAANLAGFERADADLAEECRRKGNCEEDENKDKCKICSKYRKILRKCSLVDYDDQILLACKALRTDPKLRNDWKKRTRYLLVDEYQDINQAQCELIQLLTEGQTVGLFCAGDDDQSVYSFRGGTPQYIREFEKYFGESAKIGRPSKSFRCPEHILKGARTMVESFYRESLSKPEPTFAETIKVNNKIFFYDVPSANFEARMIAGIAKKKIKTNKVIKIIIPNRMYLPSIKKALTEVGLDYKYKLVVKDEGLIRFIVLADWIEEPNSNANLRYLIDLIINNFDNLTKLLETKNSGITYKRKAASELIANLWKEVNDRNSLYKVISSSGKKSDDNPYLFALKNNLDDIVKLLKEKNNKRDGLLPFLEKCSLFVAPGGNPKGLIDEVREWKNELVGSNKATSFDPIYIYNMPSSKGLEGDVIFVIGLSDELFPYTGGDIQEQSRLFFVAMTRAKEELHVFSARTRSTRITFKETSY